MEERHRLLLVQQNPHWTGGAFAVPEFERDLLAVVERFAGRRQILAITGLRRVGKTVLMKQLLRKVQAKPLNICYLSFDDRDFQRYETAFELVAYVLQHAGEGMRYLFLDEVQKVPHWQDLLKTLYDTEDRLKIVISGSSSLDLKAYKETLAGRVLTFHLPVLTFREFVRYRGLPDRIGGDLQRAYDLTFLPKKEVYEELFRQYVLRGAFPELLEETDEEYIKKYTAEVMDKVAADIARHIGGGREADISNLIALICKSTGRVFEISNLAATLHVHRNTVSRYLDLLERAFLIKLSYNYTASVAKRLRGGKKAYIAHSAIPFAVLRYPFSLASLEGGDQGHLVETAVASNIEDLAFWRQYREVDFVLKDGTPVEIKYQEQLSPSDQAGLRSFCQRYPAARGILATKSTFQPGDILQVPVWLLLLLI